MTDSKAAAAPQAVQKEKEKQTPEDPATKTIVFLHPDLGIGGAERLVVDAAVGLQRRGHKVVIFTSHCDPKHCFDEARDGKASTSLASRFAFWGICDNADALL
jgi:hypothetical protein